MHIRWQTTKVKFSAAIYNPLSGPIAHDRVSLIRYVYVSPDIVTATQTQFTLPPPSPYSLSLIPRADLMDRCNLWPWHAVIKILIQSIWLLLFHLAIFLGIVSRKIPTVNSAETFVCCVYISLLLWPTLKENFAFQEVPDSRSVWYTYPRYICLSIWWKSFDYSLV